MRIAAVALLAGVTAFQFLPALPPAWWAVPCVALAAAAWSRRSLRPCAWLVIGWCWAWVHAAEILDDVLDPVLEGETLIVEGRVHGIPQAAGRRLRFDLDVERVVSMRREWPAPGRVRLDWYEDAAAVGAGERWRLAVRLRRPWGMVNPGGFDYERWLFRQRIRATGYVLPAASANRRLAPAPYWHLHRLRERMLARIETTLAQGPHRAVVVALALGERGGIDAAQWEVLRRTGTSHLIAISGLHVGLAAGFGFFAVQWLWARVGAAPLLLAAPRAAALGALGVAALYALLAGGSVPTQRALAAVAAAMLGRLTLRRIPASRLLAAALVAVLAVDPLAVLSIGFWLSFGAVALIAWRFAGRSPPLPRGRQLIALQAAVSVGLMPITLWAFGHGSLVAPLVNLIAVPWTGLIVVPAVLSGTVLLALWEKAGATLLGLAHGAIAVLWKLLELAAVPDAALWQPAAGGAAIALPAVVAVLLALLPRGSPGRRLAPLWLLPLAFPPIERPQDGGLRFTLLDVGQGLAAVVETRRHTLVFDAGPRFPTGLDAGAAVVVPFLQHRAVAGVDLLVVSHGDIDHAGGVAAVRAALPVEAMMSSVPEAFAAVRVAACRRGRRWRWDGVDFEVLHPPRGWRSGDNEASCVLRVRSAQGGLLLTGDIEVEAERALVAAFPERLHAEVLVVPHHGSATSSSLAFVRAVAPRYALVPAGRRNRFGFPDAAVVRRYREAGAALFVSGKAGAIEVAFTPQPQPPRAYRRTHRRYWHAR